MRNHPRLWHTAGAVLSPKSKCLPLVASVCVLILALALPFPRLADRATGYGIPAVTVDGCDPFAVRDAIADAVARHTTHRPRVVLAVPNSLPRSTSGKLGRRRCATLVHSRSQPR